MASPIRFGKYLLLERIGVGGMAEVFKAKTFGAEGFERLVAIKRILPHLVEDTDFVSMFIDEAKIAVRLQHPNIVTIHDLGRAEGTLYIGMEFVQGRDLRAVYDFEQQRASSTPVSVATHVVMKMCEALHHAHFATGPRGEPLQVIHRDVSPQNVIVSFDGEVKVADFGLAKARGRMVQTQAGVVKGKLAYMSPEQLRGDDIDHRVDVFGLGIVLFELLTGTRLFLASSDMETLRRVYEAHVPSLRDINPQIHPELDAIVRRALAKDREARYSTALELHDELQFFAYGHDCYGGASALRSYMREVFPDAAPPPEDELPVFAQAAPAARVAAPPPPLEPRETFRPPARSHAEIPPPPREIVAAPQEPAPMLVEQAPRYESAPTEPEDDTSPTERPPAVVAHRMIWTGAPPPPDNSGVASTPQRLPSEPPGLYHEDDEFSTEQLPLDDVRQMVGPDTNPAPAPDDPLFGLEWADDGPTLNTPAEASGAERRPEADGLWDDDATVVVDGKSSHGG